MSFEGKNLYGQYIDYSEKKNGPRASSAPILGLFSISFVYTAVGEVLKFLRMNARVLKFHLQIR